MAGFRDRSPRRPYRHLDLSTTHRPLCTCLLAMTRAQRNDPSELGAGLSESAAFVGLPFEHSV
jgi:hypothetical protein